MIRVLVVLALFGCGSDVESEGRLVVTEGVSCPTLTQEIVDYAEQSVSDYFGVDLIPNVYVRQKGSIMELYGTPSSVSAYGIGLECGTAKENCDRIVHETAHWFSFQTYRDWDRKHTRLKTFWSQWQGWPCLPNVALEHEVEL